MRQTVKALSKQLFGANYDRAGASLLAAIILFVAIDTAGVQIKIAPFILYLTSTFFTAGVMWQTLTGQRYIATMQGMFMLPFDNCSFVFSYVSVLGAHTLITKTLPMWALLFAAATWSAWEIMLAVLCGCMACMATAAGYQMCHKGNRWLPLFWTVCTAAIIASARQLLTVLAVATLSFLSAILYLSFVDAYDFYRSTATQKPIRHIGHTGNMFLYLTRYLLANQNYLMNTVGLCLIACFLPILFQAFPNLHMFPIGCAVLSLNTPISTLLSSDPDLEQAMCALPGQTARFGWQYVLFIFAVNMIVASFYLCSWLITYGQTNFSSIGMLFLFALQNAVLSVILEWKKPIRNWKTESDLWRHPRKYLIPLWLIWQAACYAI